MGEGGHPGNRAGRLDRRRSTRHNQFIGMDLCDPAIDFLALASSLGIPSRRIERADDIAGAVEEGIRSGCPNLIELPIMP